MNVSRRTVLRGVAGVGGVSTVVGTAAAQNRITRQVVIPRVDEFEDNYVGQWLAVKEMTDADADPVEDCEFAEWSADQTQAYRGQLLDRRTEVPVVVDVNVLADGTKSQLEDDTAFIVNDAVACTDEYVGLAVESVPRRAVVGEPIGPTVTESDGQPGMGVVAGVAGVATAVVARALRERDG